MGYDAKGFRQKLAKNGIFYTPKPLAEYMASFLPKDVQEVYDPTCGHGSLFAVFPENVKKYGQDNNPEAVEAAKEIPNSEIVCADTLHEPAFMGKKFRVIIANPPYSVKWNAEGLEDDPRFCVAPCLAPPSKADFAFLLHILYYLAEDGVASVLNFPGIAYRGQREGKIRRWLIEQNVIEAVISIPGKQFVDTSIAQLLFILKKHRNTTAIHFIDKENELERLVPLKEVQENGYNLSVNNYVQKEEPKEEIDPEAVENDVRAMMLKNVRNGLELSFMGQKLMGGASIAPLLDSLAAIIDEFRGKLANLETQA